MNYESFPSKEMSWQKRLIALSIGIGVLATTAACSNQSTEHKPTSSPTSSVEQTVPPIEISPTDLPEVKLLKGYEQKVGVAPQMMEFINFPDTEASARKQAQDMSTTLKTLHEQGASPIVIMEPNFDDVRQMDLKKFSSGDYDEVVDTYFATLKEAGVSDEEMGQWVPFPEPNIPGWGDDITNPSLFITNVSKLAAVQKHYFPESRASIMLDSHTYPDHDKNYAHGTADFGELAPYLAIKTPGLFDSFGYQGFTESNTDSARDYLDGSIAVKAAQALGVRKVWFNTGTYSKAQNWDNKNDPLIANPRRREKVLEDILYQAQTVQRAGLKVEFINIFGQNKFKDGESDFGYKTQDDLTTLKTFVAESRANGIPVSIFDAPN